VTWGFPGGVCLPQGASSRTTLKRLIKPTQD
jgi:hypothetical protein